MWFCIHKAYVSVYIYIYTCYHIYIYIYTYIHASKLCLDTHVHIIICLIQSRGSEGRSRGGRGRERERDDRTDSGARRQGEHEPLDLAGKGTALTLLQSLREGPPQASCAPILPLPQSNVRITDSTKDVSEAVLGRAVILVLLGLNRDNGGSSTDPCGEHVVCVQVQIKLTNQLVDLLQQMVLRRVRWKPPMTMALRRPCSGPVRLDGPPVVDPEALPFSSCAMRSSRWLRRQLVSLACSCIFDCASWTPRICSCTPSMRKLTLSAIRSSILCMATLISPKKVCTSARRACRTSVRFKAASWLGISSVGVAAFILVSVHCLKPLSLVAPFWAGARERRGDVRHVVGVLVVGEVAARVVVEEDVSHRSGHRRAGGQLSRGTRKVEEVGSQSLPLSPPLSWFSS